jgi:hypothetical protein
MDNAILTHSLGHLEYLKNALLIETNRGTFYVDRSQFNHFNCVGKDVNFYFYVIPELFNTINKIIVIDLDKYSQTIVYESYDKLH